MLDINDLYWILPVRGCGICGRLAYRWGETRRADRLSTGIEVLARSQYRHVDDDSYADEDCSASEAEFDEFST